jgi:hypothetical protein
MIFVCFACSPKVSVSMFIIVLAAIWITFPFIVMSGLRRIEKLLAKQNQTLAQIADRQNEANRALQFLVDKK